MVSISGLSLAGYPVLTLSPRLSVQAIVKLVQNKHCECLIFHQSPFLLLALNEAEPLMSLQTPPVLSCHDHDKPKHHPPRF